MAEPSLSKVAVKILLNLALIAGEALVRGGELDIGVETNPGQTEIVVRATGPRLAVDAAVRQTLLGAPPQPDVIAPRLGPALLALSLARRTHGKLQLSDADPTQLLLGALIPN